MSWVVTGKTRVSSRGNADRPPPLDQNMVLPPRPAHGHRASNPLRDHPHHASLWPAGYVPPAVLARRKEEAERKRREEERERRRKEETAAGGSKAVADAPKATKKKKKKKTAAGGAGKRAWDGVLELERTGCDLFSRPA